MSLRSKVEQIARDAAERNINTLLSLRAAQVQGNTRSNLATVSSVNGANIVIVLADGTKKSVFNAGQRYLGNGDQVITDSQNFCL